MRHSVCATRPPSKLEEPSPLTALPPHTRPWWPAALRARWDSLYTIVPWQVGLWLGGAGYLAWGRLERPALFVVFALLFCLRLLVLHRINRRIPFMPGPARDLARFRFWLVANGLTIAVIMGSWITLQLLLGTTHPGAFALSSSLLLVLGLPCAHWLRDWFDRNRLIVNSGGRSAGFGVTLLYGVGNAILDHWQAPLWLDWLLLHVWALGMFTLMWWSFGAARRDDVVEIATVPFTNPHHDDPSHAPRIR